MKQLGMIVLLMALTLGQLARAGPWLPSEGDGFSAASLYMVPRDGHGSRYQSLYFEYGLRPRLTLGLDWGRGVSGDGKTILFLRLPLGRAEGRQRLAFELGLGRIAGQDVLRPGLSYGRSFDSRYGSGWMALDVLGEIDLDTRSIDVKTDLTLGLSRSDRRKLMVQLQAGRAAGEAAFLRVVPSIAWQVRDHWHLEVGATQALTGARETGVKLGVWRSF